MKLFNILFVIIVILALISITPFLITIIFPGLCYGCKYIGKLHQNITTNKFISDTTWFPYIMLFIYFIYRSSFLKNKLLKYILILFFVFMIYLPVFPIISVINIILSLAYKNPPIMHDYHDIFPSSVLIEKSSSVITGELKNYLKNNQPECIRKTTPGFRIEINSVDDNCWRALYLKKVGKINSEMIKYFPNTVELLKDKQIHNAFFSILDPGVEIPPHIGYYKGYLRYHLGVVIPNNDTEITDDKAYLVCGGEKYIWKEDKGILFDDMYLHHVKNPTNKTRVVLYLDVKRSTNSYFFTKLNDIGIYLLENSFVVNMFNKNQHIQRKI